MKPRFLRLLIRGNRFSQTYVATQAGITEKHLSRICSGATGVSEATAQKLSKVLGVPEEVLYLGLYLESLTIERGDLIDVPEDDDDDTEPEPEPAVGAA